MRIQDLIAVNVDGHSIAALVFTLNYGPNTVVATSSELDVNEPDLEVVGLNFSSATSPELILKTFDHYCEYRKTSNGLVLAPTQGNNQLENFSLRSCSILSR